MVFGYPCTGTYGHRVRSMNSRLNVIVVTLGLIVLILGLLVSWHRSASPEWYQYQQKAMALQLERKSKELAAESDPEKRKLLETSIRLLKTKKPEIIEISPFGGKLPVERCLTCHFGIEDMSQSHPNSVFGCVICHGGNAPDLSVQGAHKNLRGGKNPSDLENAVASCGGGNIQGITCHGSREDKLLNRAEHVQTSLMSTNAGIIGILRFQWGVDDISNFRFGIQPVTDGVHSLKQIPPDRPQKDLVDLSNSHFRKFCGSCHLWGSRSGENVQRRAGCASCHGTYGSGYLGDDPTIDRKDPSRPTTHSLTNKVADERCKSCHNRSARIGLNYHGEMESSQYGTPYVNGTLNHHEIDGRFMWKLVPDIHSEKKMACIDCHTGQDTMGDGHLYPRMKDQVEIRCEDCHGSPSKPPETMRVSKWDPLVTSLLRTSPLKATEGDTILKTSKGRPMPNVRVTDKGIFLTAKITGKDHPVRVITGKRDGHAIKGHERLECDVCHSAWSPQCYGCHQALDFRSEAKDHLSQKSSIGRWSEGRNYFRYERNILGINSRGKVGILVPGCQVWNSVISPDGKILGGYDSKIMPLKNGLTSIAMGSTHPHTTRKESPRCIECHLDPKALGLGDGMYSVDGKGIQLEAQFDSKSSGLNIDFSLESIVDSEGKNLQSTSHPESRGFNKEELQKIINISQCIVCHDRYDDPVWRLPGPYFLRPPCRAALEHIAPSSRPKHDK